MDTINNSLKVAAAAPSQYQRELDDVIQLLSEEQYAQAFPRLQQLAATGTPAEAGLAQQMLGCMYERAYYVTQDFQEAMRCYEKAVEHGNVKAWSCIGCLYHYALGVPQNFEKAMECYKKGAEANETTAWLNMGGFYEHGWGVLRDFQEAMRCYERIAEDDNTNPTQRANAQFRLGRMCLNGLGMAKPDAEKAYNYFIEADKNQYPQAAFMAAKACMVIAESALFDRRENIDVALAWYKKAANENHLVDSYVKEANYQIAMILRKENIALHEIPYYLKKAHAQGHPHALKEMADLSNEYREKYEKSLIKDRVLRDTADALAAIVLNIKMEQQLKIQGAIEELHTFAEQHLTPKEVDQLFDENPVISGLVTDWYSEHNSVYASVALNLAKIRFEQNNFDKVEELVTEVNSARLTAKDSAIKLGLVEWYLTRSTVTSSEEKESAVALLETINVDEVSDVYPETQKLFRKLHTDPPL